jgi:hypothetical protein
MCRQTVSGTTSLIPQRGKTGEGPAADLLLFDFPYFPTCHAALLLAFHLWTQKIFFVGLRV